MWYSHKCLPLGALLSKLSAHTLTSASFWQLPSFTVLGAAGGPHLPDKIIHYIARSAKSPNFASVFKKLWQGEAA